jgi:ATP-dependent exoDNAse (exonuclease V) beta subunit
MSILNPVLETINSHQRDKNILFYEPTHTYTITTDPTNKYTSVTTWNHSHFPHFNADQVIKNMMRGKNWKEGHKYWGLTAEQIKAQWASNGAAVSDAGTNMHYEIECFMNNSDLEDHYTHVELYRYYLETQLSNPIPIIETTEGIYFIKFIKEHLHFTPYRTEWTVYHEEAKLAGSIDMVYENPDGTLSIYDWKRAKDISRINTFNKFALNKIICHMPDSNFWHYALQLNTYKKIIEDKYGKIVTDLYLVRLHPDCEDNTYELIKLPDLKKELNDLFAERINQLLKE